jgi:hypothetical protein
MGFKKDFDSGNAKKLEALTKFSLMCLQLPRVDSSDPEAIEKRIYWYFDQCIALGLKPGMAGLSAALKIPKDTLQSWKLGERRPGQKQQELMVNVSMILEQLMEGYMNEGQVAPLVGMFFMNNNYGYTQKQEIQVTASNQLDSGKSVAELEQAYLESIPQLDAPNAEPEKVKAEDVIVTEAEKKL